MHKHHQRLIGRVGAHQSIGGVFEHGLKDDQVGRLIVNDQNADRIGKMGRRRVCSLWAGVVMVQVRQWACHWIAHRNSQTRIKDKSCAVSTGLEM